MSFIELNPDLKRASSALERIATALEAIALHEYGVQPKPKDARDPIPSPDEDISYADNEITLRQELEQIVRPGDVREREGQVVEEEIGDLLNQDRRA